uniref:Uncharacterized protein n=1 Tax=Ciona savignyi TaxID=51511 RepID=H2YV63_CIOSA
MIEYTRIMRACQQQIEMQRNTIFQNMLQKTQSNKSNGPIAGMDPNGPRSTQSMLSPLNNMANLGQALPPNVPMPNNREQKSRFMHNWKRPNSLDYPQNLPNNMGFFPGPGGDFNGMRFESPQDEMPSHLDKQYYSSDTAAKADEALNAISAAEPTSEPSSALADIGPPEFT